MFKVDNGAGKFTAAEPSFSDIVLYVGSITTQAVQQVSGGRLHTVWVEIGQCSACL